MFATWIGGLDAARAGVGAGRVVAVAGSELANASRRVLRSLLRHGARRAAAAKFAPGGDLFVASPTTATTGGNPAGAIGGIALLPDRDHDGVADSTLTFLDNVPSIQGLLFAGNTLYYQDSTTIRSIAYQIGDRQPAGAMQVLTVIDDTVVPQDVGPHWPKVLDVAMDGTVYITNGGDQNDVCTSVEQARGSIFSLRGLADGGTPALVAKGFRNPIALRCEANHNVCLAIELGRDYSATLGGREKLVPVRQGDDWGFPCCATQNVPFSDETYQDTGAMPNCSQITPDTDSFIIGHTPFGLDFETGNWPAPWGNRVFVTLHGVVGSWTGSRVVAIGLDPITGLPLPATELGDGGPGADSLLQFAGGWDDGHQNHGRPAPVTFAPDGRMFIGDDNAGLIVWVAPVDLMQK